MNVMDDFDKALLSKASYVDLENVSTPAQLTTVLAQNDFSPAQAADFVTRWRVASHQPDTVSGFSATLFERVDKPGTYTLAIRGSLGVIDFAEDLFGIAVQGVASIANESLEADDIGPVVYDGMMLFHGAMLEMLSAKHTWQKGSMQ